MRGKLITNTFFIFVSFFIKKKMVFLFTLGENPLNCVEIHYLLQRLIGNLYQYIKKECV